VNRGAGQRHIPVSDRPRFQRLKAHCVP
jgi:hypothetical protein